VVAAHYKKDDLLNYWSSSSDISGYHRLSKDTALSEHGICELMAEHGMGTACYV